LNVNSLYSLIAIIITPTKRTPNYVDLSNTLALLAQRGLLLLALTFISGCSTVGYYSQSVVGHSRLMLARQSVDTLIERESLSAVSSNSVPSNLHDQLVLSKQLKQFAVDELGLPKGKSYNSYVALKREFPVWTVVAAPEFSLDAKRWCYPVIGCANYRGYFKQASALRYAEKIQNKGFDTVVNGASAYSTLGWFADPLLPSMMRYGDTSFAETLFHEMAHQRLYINGDSDFNEAFASLVAEIGIVRWLSQNQNAESASELLNYQASLQVQADFYQLLNQTKKALQELYASEQTIESKGLAKQHIFSELKIRHTELVNNQWGGRAWYQSWFEPELNNAKFVAISTYRERVDELRNFLQLCDNDLENFYRVLSSLKPVNHRVVLPLSCS